MSDLRAFLRIDGSADGAVGAARQAEQALDGTKRAATEAGQALGAAAPHADRLQRESQGAAQALDRMSRELGEIPATSARAAAGMDRAADQAQRFDRSMGSARGAAVLLGGALATIGGVRFVGEMIEAREAAVGLETGLSAVAGGAQQGAIEMAWARDEALRLGLVAQDATKSMVNLGGATKDTALMGAETREIWLSVSEAGLVLGRTQEQIGRGLTAIEQIAGKGVVSMEEVRQQLAEAIPGAVQIAARAMDMTTQEFDKLVSKGDLLATDFLPRFAAQLREEYGPALEEYLASPMGQARREMALFETQMRDLQAAAGEEFLGGMVEGLGRLNGALGEAEAMERAADLGRVLGEGLGLAADAAVLLSDNIELVVAGAQVLGGVALTRWLVTVATEARASAVALGLKGQAARTASMMAASAMAQEAAAAGGVAAALAAQSQAELRAAQAIAAKAAAERQAAVVAYAHAAASAAAAGSDQVRAARALEAARALGVLRAADQASALATTRLAAAQTATVAAGTRMAGAMALARGAGASLLALVGGPWGAAFLAAGGAVWYLTQAQEAQRKEIAQTNASIAEQAAELERTRQAQAVLGNESQHLVTAQDAAAVAAASLTGEANKLADAHYRAAAAAKAHYIEELRLKTLTASDNATQALENFNRVRADADRVARGPRGEPGAGAAAAGMAVAGIDTRQQGAAVALADPTFAALKEATANARGFAAQLREAMDRPLDAYVTPPTSPVGGGGGGSDDKKGGGRQKRDRAADVVADLRLEAEGLKSHAEAALQGVAALDAWEIAEAGRQAVARSGLEVGSAAAEAIRDQAEEVERLAQADERISRAAGLVTQAERDIAAMERRQAALLGGRDALEALRIEEAGLAVLHDARVESLAELNDVERRAVETAIEAARAREAEAIATEQAEAAAASVEDIEERIAAEQRRVDGLTRGVQAEVDYARAEFIRQEVERAGLEITDAAAAAIIAKADALFTLTAATDAAVAGADFDRTLRFARMSNRERELALRTETLIGEIYAANPGLAQELIKTQAEARAQTELWLAGWADAAGDAKDMLRDHFAETGDLGFEELGDALEKELRRAVYDALLAKPISIMIDAVMGGMSGGISQLLGLGGGAGGAGGGGLIGNLLGSLGLEGIMGPGSMLGNAGIGAIIGKSLGLGSGNGLMDAGLSIGGSWAGGALGGLLGLSGAAGMAGMLGSVMGPLGAIAGLALGSLFKDEKRPYARADIVAKNGQFVVAGADAADGGPLDETNKLGKAIADSLNAAAALFGIDMSKIDGLYTTAGYVAGGNYKGLKGQGYFGGDINGAIDYYDQGNARDRKGDTLGKGVSFTQYGDAEGLAEAVVRETILRAIAAGASDLSDAEKRLVQTAANLEEAIQIIAQGRGFAQSIDDAIRQITDPAGFERDRALKAVQDSYEALRTEALKLIEAGLISADVLEKLEELRDLQRDAVLNGGDPGGVNPFIAVAGRLQSWLDAILVSDTGGGTPQQQRDLAMAQYERVLALAQTGDADALSDITQYADRLLRADREATGSFARRQELLDRVVADIRDLIGRAPNTGLEGLATPIVEAIGAANTALADLLASLPPEIAGPIIAQIMQSPDWAEALLGANVEIPPALAALAAEIAGQPIEIAGPIVTELLKGEAWSRIMTEHMALVPPGLGTLAAALDGLPLGIVAPIVAQLMATPAWSGFVIDYLGALPPSLDLLGELLKDQPGAIVGPIIAALMATPDWTSTVIDWLAATPASLELLIDLLTGQPGAIVGPIVEALLQTPAWSALLTENLAALPASLELLEAVLAGLPEEVATALLRGLLATPEWATAVIGYLEATPPSLDRLAAILEGHPAAIVAPLLAALAQDPAWTSTALDYLALVAPGLDGLAALLEGQPAAIVAPLVAALLQDPAWSAVALDYLSAFAPGLDGLAALLEGQPSAIAGPIVAALLQDPAWSGLALDYLSTLEPGLESLIRLTAGQPAEISGPIIAALLAEPGWATVLAGQLAALADDPAWASMLEAALGDGLGSSIDDLTLALLALMRLLVGDGSDPDVPDYDPDGPTVPGDPTGPTGPRPDVPGGDTTGGGWWPGDLDTGGGRPWWEDLMDRVNDRRRDEWGVSEPMGASVMGRAGMGAPDTAAQLAELNGRIEGLARATQQGLGVLAAFADRQLIATEDQARDLKLATARAAARG